MYSNPTDNDGIVCRRPVIFKLVLVVTPFSLDDLGEAFAPQADVKKDGQRQCDH